MKIQLLVVGTIDKLDLRSSVLRRPPSADTSARITLRGVNRQSGGVEWNSWKEI